ncbi:MAG: hypothetical protein O6938_02165, partial [Gammaproteobacteria bacterium]|nr:hypothetical protein [Gammaproteobacteria bacterium]
MNPQGIFFSRQYALLFRSFRISLVIAMDGVYAGIAGANSCENKVLRTHRGNSLIVRASGLLCTTGS